MKRKYKDLNDCPFCGKHPTLVINEYSEIEKFYHIECECGAMMTLNGALFDNETQAIKAWNRRK